MPSRARVVYEERPRAGGADARAWAMAAPGGAPLGRARHISSPPLIESSAPVM